MFEFTEERIEHAALALRYHLAPWDVSSFGANTAAISAIDVHDATAAADAFLPFRAWCEANRVCLVSSRVAQDRLAEAGFLEAQGFRFIELNYRPHCNQLDDFVADPGLVITAAGADDEPAITAMAAQTFDTGRLHVDPFVDPRIGNRRYGIWVANAFRNPRQTVLKCVLDGAIVAFMVVEQPSPTSRFWSLVGLAPGLAGRGLGRRVWRAMLAHHRSEGVREVSTSISSHNIAVHNLYVSLGFRFPAPTITLHWCPSGTVRLPG